VRKLRSKVKLLKDKDNPDSVRPMAIFVNVRAAPQAPVGTIRSAVPAAAGVAGA
jgi:hypothetical protein